MRSKFKGIRLAWVRSFLIVITIIMLLLVAFFIWIRFKVTNDAVISNYNASSFIKNIIDERLDTIQNLSYEIGYNDVALQLLEAKTKDDFKTEKTYTFVNNIRNFVLSNNFVEDIYIYYPKYDYVLGKQGIYSSLSYYLLQNSGSTQGYEKWLDAIKNSENMSYYSLTNNGNTDLFFSRFAAYGAGSANRCFLIAKINKNSVNNVLQWSNTQYPHQLVAITGRNNQLYTFNGDQQLINLVSEAIHQKGAQVLSDNYYSYKNYFIIVQPSKMNGLQYLLVRNRGNVLEMQSSITNILIICILTCLIAGILLSLYMSNKNSKPLLSLVQRMKTAPDEENRNEYEIISHKIDTLFIENETAIQQMEQQQRIIFTSFVRAMLSADYRNETTINSLTSMYGVDFENPYFCVAVFHLPACLDEKEDNISADIDDLCENYGSDSFCIYHAFIEPNYLFILNFEAEEITKEEKLNSFLDVLREYSAAKELVYSLVAGSIQTNVCSIAVSYQEALMQMQASEKTGELSFVTNPLTRGSDLFYDFQHDILSKEYMSAQRLLPDLFEQYLNHPEPTVANCRQSAVINQILEAVLHTADMKKIDLQKENIRSILTSGSTSECMERLAGVLKKLDEIERPKEELDDSTASKIKSIIDHSYSNPMLGLSSIADDLGVSNSYISRVFKKIYHIGVVEYINKTRIDHAKELIVKGDISMKAIAIKVGFSSDVSFIRVFKKYERITPGKYKQ